MHILGKTLSQFSLRLIAYCLMDNHFHLFAQQKLEESHLSNFMRELGRQYVRRFNDRHGRVGPLFQNRFRSRAVNTDIYAKVLMRYIHQNPKAAGVVASLSDYSWSSYACYIGALPVWGWLDVRWGLGLFGENQTKAIAEFERFHQQETAKPELKKLDNMKHHLIFPQFNPVPLEPG